MNAERRLAQIVSALEAARLACLVMGGHAVRYFGVERTTIDFDLHVSVPSVDRLEGVLRGSRLCDSSVFREGPSWRRQAFRRFQIGRLPDGREEWLEFWFKNHLLPPFAELHARREVGRYGGHELAFLGLPDLIRSKETERNSDWDDLALLEEILDARHASHAADPEGLVLALGCLRSRKGYEHARAAGWLASVAEVRRALEQVTSPMTWAYLAPHAPDAPSPAVTMLDEAFVRPVRRSAPGSPQHLALVEAVRRLYKARAMAADRRDKMAAIA